MPGAGRARLVLAFMPGAGLMSVCEASAGCVSGAGLMSACEVMMMVDSDGDVGDDVVVGDDGDGSGGVVCVCVCWWCWCWCWWGDEFWWCW